MEIAQVNEKAVSLTAKSPLGELTRRDALTNLSGSVHNTECCRGQTP